MLALLFVWRAWLCLQLCLQLTDDGAGNGHQPRRIRITGASISNSVPAGAGKSAPTQRGAGMWRVKYMHITTGFRQGLDRVSLGKHQWMLLGVSGEGQRQAACVRAWYHGMVITTANDDTFDAIQNLTGGC